MGGLAGENPFHRWLWGRLSPPEQFQSKRGGNSEGERVSGSEGDGEPFGESDGEAVGDGEGEPSGEEGGTPPGAVEGELPGDAAGDAAPALGDAEEPDNSGGGGSTRGVAGSVGSPEGRLGIF